MVCLLGCVVESPRVGNGVCGVTLGVRGGTLGVHGVRVGSGTAFGIGQP